MQARVEGVSPSTGLSQTLTSSDHEDSADSVLLLESYRGEKMIADPDNIENDNDEDTRDK